MKYIVSVHPLWGYNICFLILFLKEALKLFCVDEARSPLRAVDTLFNHDNDSTWLALRLIAKGQIEINDKSIAINIILQLRSYLL